MMTSLEGRVIAITGAASGIALATAHLLASRGASISIADIRQEPLNLAVADIKRSNPNVKLYAKAVNVKNGQEVGDWLDETIKHLGPCQSSFPIHRSPLHHVLRTGDLFFARPDLCDSGTISLKEKEALTPKTIKSERRRQPRRCPQHRKADRGHHGRGLGFHHGREPAGRLQLRQDGTAAHGEGREHRERVELY